MQGAGADPERLGEGAVARGAGSAPFLRPVRGAGGSNRGEEQEGREVLRPATERRSEGEPSLHRLRGYQSILDAHELRPRPPRTQLNTPCPGPRRPLLGAYSYYLILPDLLEPLLYGP